MTVTIPIWTGRVSPLFDVARRLLVVEIRDGGAVSRRQEFLPQAGPRRRAAFVAALGADVLICGAISPGFRTALISAGVTVVSQTCGPVEDVLQAFVSKRLPDGTAAASDPDGRGSRIDGAARPLSEGGP